LPRVKARSGEARGQHGGDGECCGGGGGVGDVVVVVGVRAAAAAAAISRQVTAHRVVVEEMQDALLALLALSLARVVVGAGIEILICVKWALVR
jgi:hypothetical protein